jgi:hypothetical protein
MATSRKTRTDLTKFFKTKRVETEDGPYLECKYKEGTQMIVFPDLNGERIPDTTSVLISLKVKDENIIQKIFSINYARGGYHIRYRGNIPALPLGETKICGLKAIVKNPDPIMRKIRKQMGEIHLTGIPIEVPLDESVNWFEEKFGIKVEKSKLGVVDGFDIYNGARIYEIERSKLQSIKRANFIHGFLTSTWYKGCIFHRKCIKCG